jgi:hypothetical protein
METPTNSSINIDEPVAITLLAVAEGNCSGRFVSWSHDGINVKLDTGLKVGSLVKIETGGDLMVAEVSDCEADGAEFSAGLFLLEWIEKSELERIKREMASDSAPKLFPVSVAA